MKALAFGFFLIVVSGVLAAPSAGEVEALRKSFPRHMAPGEVQKMHPVARECFGKFRRLADGLEAGELSAQAVELARVLRIERRTQERDAGDVSFALGDAGRAAARANVRWIDQKLAPWAKRVAEVARK